MYLCKRLTAHGWLFRYVQDDEDEETDPITARILEARNTKYRKVLRFMGR